MTKILITGATGAIGSEILYQLKAAGKLDNVTVLARSSKSTTKCLKPFADSIKIISGDITDIDVVRS
ncbi:MAG: NAD-dependent epimerase/dehydratase family protein, partial [Bacteroidia bacterium]|nr:NAD-dependent epimerase/dehydratase family protein [Bacteroidia bacterium]